jgi:NAD(P)H-nitrite reductase large subunit
MKHIILGNGPAGVVAAETLRRAAPGDEILLVGNEDEPPYSRMAIPYLLEGNIDESGTYLRKTAGHFEATAHRQHGGRAVAVNAEKRTVLFADGEHFESYDRLLIATGSHPVPPADPGIDLPEVQTCWTLEDARAIAATGQARRARAATRRRLHRLHHHGSLGQTRRQLTVVEMGDRMVPRMMTPKAGGMIKRWVEEARASASCTSGRASTVSNDGDASTPRLRGDACPLAK